MADIGRLEYLSGQLHQGAKKFSDAAQTLRQQAQRLDWSAQDLATGVDSWAGAGSKNFQAAWQGYHANTQKSATALDNTSQALTKLAQKIDDSVQQMRAAQAMQTAGTILTVGLVVVDVLQLGLDPVTDAATVGAVGADGALAGEADAAATAVVEADAEIGAELDQIVGEIENVSDAGDIPVVPGEEPGDINFDNSEPAVNGDGGMNGDGTGGNGSGNGNGGGGNGNDGMGGNGSGDEGINGLKNTDNFRPGAIDHVFKGDLKGTNAGGYHYEGVPNTGGSTVPGTETPPNEYGVYQAQVTVNGVPKTANGGYSTFFPKSMSPQEVVDSINEAYNSRSFVPGTGNTYAGQTSSGMTILMYLDSAGRIISAFPEY
jgi:WXG100 family type VII secretion target